MKKKDAKETVEKAEKPKKKLFVKKEKVVKEKAVKEKAVKEKAVKEKVSADKLAEEAAPGGKKEKKRWPAWKKAVVICAAVIGAAIIVVGGLWINAEVNYNKAVELVEAEDIADADESLQRVFSFYKDAPELRTYISAMYYEDAQKFDNAKKVYGGLGEYRDAAQKAIETDYAHANQLLDSDKYDEAKALFVGLDDYSQAKAMAQECDYRKATVWLDDEDFESARVFFKSLGDYKDAQDMILETDFRETVTWLDAGDFKEAKRGFEKLARNGLEKAEEMVLESDYRKALELIEDAKWIPAMLTLEKLDYKDAGDQLTNAKQGLFNQALGEFDRKQYTIARVNFDRIAGFKRSVEYVELCDLLEQADNFAVPKDEKNEWPNGLTRIEYDRLVSFAGDLIEMEDFVLKDAAIHYFLIGNWDGPGSKMMRMKIKGDSWRITHRMPQFFSGYFDFRDGVCYIFKKDKYDDGKDTWRFTYIDDDTIEIYCFKDEKTYTMKRD